MHLSKSLRAPRPDAAPEGRLLLVCPDAGWLTRASVALENAGYRVHTATTGPEAASVAAQLPIRLVLMHDMPCQAARRMVGWLRSSAMRRRITIVQLLQRHVTPVDVTCVGGADHHVPCRDLTDLVTLVKGFFHISAPCPPLLPPQRLSLQDLETHVERHAPLGHDLRDALP